MPENIDFLVGKITEGQLAIKDQLHQHQEESRDGRQRLYKEIEATNKATDRLQSEVTAIRQKMELMEAELGSWDRLRQRLIGGAMVIAAIAGALGGITVYFWKWIIIKLGLSA